jgi:phage gpG-like protein
MIHCEVKIADLVKLKELPQKLFNTAFFNELGQYMVSSTQRKIRSGIRPENAPLTKSYKKSGLTLRDTGRLLSSITYKADAISVVVGTNVIYGRIHQLGGTIQPKKARKLWIPAGWETRKLMRRYGASPGAVVKAMKSAGYRVWKSRSGKAILYADKKGKPRVLFVLKDSVQIPARPYLKVDDADVQVITKKVERWLKK